METTPEIGQEPADLALETSLPAETQGASPESSPGAATDGLAANLAAQYGTGEAPGGGEATAAGKRRGRPPIHGLYSKAAGSDGHRPAALPGETQVEQPEGAGPGSDRVSIPPDMFSKIVQETLSIGEMFARGQIEGAAIGAGLTPDEIEPQLKQTEIGESRRELVGELAPLAAQEWGMDPQMSPTAAIGLLLGPWVIGSTMAYLTLARLAQERQAQKP